MKRNLKETDTDIRARCAGHVARMMGIRKALQIFGASQSA